MPRKDNAKTQKQKIEEKKAKEQSKADKNNDRNKTKTNIYSTGGNKTTGGTTTKPTTKPTGSTGNKSTGGTTTKPTGGTTTKPTGTATKPTSGGTSSGSSVSKGVEDIFKGNSSSKNNWDNTKAGNTVKDVAGSGNTGGSTGNTGGVSLPSVSKDNKAAWDGVAKGDRPATVPGLSTGGTTTKPTGGTTTKPTGGTSSGGGSVSKGVEDIFKDNSSSKSNWDNTKAGSTVNNTAGSGNTGGGSLPSVSKDNKAAWDDFAKGNGPATAPGLPATGTGASTPRAPSTPSAPSTSGGSGNASPSTPSQTPPGTSSSGYDNGGLTAEQIKAMQRFYGTNADGMWGANSTAAAGGKTAADAWNAYQTALREQLEQEQQQQQQQQQPQQPQGQQTGTGTPGTGTTLPSAPAGSTGKITADVSGMRNLLDQWLSAAKQQQEAAINYGVEQGVNELRRAEEDAQQQYQAQQDQINIDEARAKDNQALYAEARGDRGGIGAAQYDSIMNAAAQNRLTVSQQQTKLSTDTARQIADLRAQGEYKKADAVLELTQKYLTQLMSLEQWALNYQMDVAQFNLQLEKWQADYALSLAKLKGTSTGGTSSGGSGGTYTGGSGGTSYGGSGGTSSGSSGVNPSAMTSAEVKEWQRKLGVTADGIWGPNTQAAYDKLMNPNKNQDPHIVNPSSTSSGWVAIPGHGRFSYQELKVLVDKGKVKETKKSDGTYAYTWVNK